MVEILRCILHIKDLFHLAVQKYYSILQKYREYNVMTQTVSHILYHPPIIYLTILFILFLYSSYKQCDVFVCKTLYLFQINKGE